MCLLGSIQTAREFLDLNMDFVPLVRPMAVRLFLCSNKMDIFQISILFYPITLEGRRGTTDEFATIPFHLDLFSAALVELAKSISVHSLILSSHLFFCLPFFFFLSLCPVGSSLLNQKTLRHGQTILAFVSWPGSGVRHILQWLLGSFCEPPHW